CSAHGRKGKENPCRTARKQRRSERVCLFRQPARQPPRCFGDLVRTAREADTYVFFAAWAEGRAGRDANSRFIDEIKSQFARIFDPIESAEQVESRLRISKACATARLETVAQNIAALLHAGDLRREEIFAVLDRRLCGALYEDRHAGGRVLNQVFD